MITTLKSLIDQPRPLPMAVAGFFSATAMGAALLAAALSGPNAAQAGNPGTAVAASAAVGVVHGAMDHSALDNPALLPEPNAALLHSNPNEYVPLRGAAAVVR
jgi:hypothetical protein